MGESDTKWWTGAVGVISAIIALIAIRVCVLKRKEEEKD